MKIRVWLLIGVVVGLAVAAGHLPYLAGAGRSLADSAQRIVNSGANRLVHAVASTGAPKRVVIGLGGFLAILAPGVASLLLIVAARAALWLKLVVGVLIVAVGAASYVYQGSGKATGALLLALAVAGLAALLSGPLLAAPMAAVAALIGAEFIPGLFSKHHPATQASVNQVHVAIFSHPGTPTALQILLLLAALVPFAVAGWLIVRR